ncbi:hypothetical protein ADU37_CDS06390 [Thermococcus sp. 2319x1]|uniref:hypothetical protein n=1 Tax=Thermococcus sp. 2319x1 TaxID=1674923 RepID=UPI00073A6848|nr:hypothetical protein [Thermococcus sp. 2319x1]ALV62338.1 hypothetical protein ADU37_CDS06390 [Thermococcus sp. 2319x1]
MRAFLYLSIVWFKILLRRLSYIVFLFMSVGIMYTLNDLSPLMAEVPREILMTNMLIMTVIIGWVYSIVYNPRVMLGIETLPASGWKLSILSLLSFLPFLLFVYRSSVNISLYYILFSVFLFLGIIDNPLFLLVGFGIALRFSFIVSTVFLTTLLVKFVLKLVPARRVIITWIKRTPITIVNPLFLWSLSLAVAGMLLIALKVQNTKLWVSPIGGGATYFSAVSTSGDFQTLLFGGVFTSLSMILSLTLPIFFSAVSYLDNYIWSLQVLAGRFWRDFAIRSLLNAIFGTLMILFIFIPMVRMGIGSFEGAILVVSLSLLVTSAVSPSPDVGSSLGNYLLVYMVLAFIIGRLSIHIHQEYLISMLLLMTFPVHLLWLKLKLTRR